MPLLLLKELPRYECLLEAAETLPDLDASACNVFLHILKAADEFSAIQTELLARHGISQGRFTVLTLLDRCEKGFCTPAELAEESAVTRATMTGLVDTLEKDGLVVREADPADRRAIHVRLTADGQALFRKILPDYLQMIARLIKPLNEKERMQFVRLLQKISPGQDAAEGTHSTSSIPGLQPGEGKR